MLEHHIQRAIVYRLAFSRGLRFNQLKPDEIENKLFDYHLKIVIRDGFVEKGEIGLYSLTAEGRRLGQRAFEKQLSMADRAESVLFLVIRDGTDGPWLLYRRAMHPLLGKVGFMHATPVVGQSLTSCAQKQCLEKTGLKCKFEVLGSGYFTTYDQETLESYVNFSLLFSHEVKGGLLQNDQAAEYFWDEKPNFDSPEMIPNMPTLSMLYQKGKTFFVEKTLKY